MNAQQRREMADKLFTVSVCDVGRARQEVRADNRILIDAAETLRSDATALEALGVEPAEVAKNLRLMADETLDAYGFQGNREAHMGYIGARVLEQTALRLAEALAEVERVKAAVKDLAQHVDGRLPTRGWLRDNDASRFALDRLLKEIGHVE